MTQVEVRRPSDGELVGFVVGGDGDWLARTVFGADLAWFGTREQATRYLVEHGLAVLAEPWWAWSAHDGRWRRGVLIEAGAGWVQVRFGRDPKSTDVRTYRGAEAAGLRRRRPDADGMLGA